MGRQQGKPYPGRVRAGSYPIALAGTASDRAALMKRTLLTVILTIVVLLILEAAACLLLVYSGAYNISTANHDNGVINWALDNGMTRSVARHAKGIKAPQLSAAGMIEAGFKDYEEMCVSCHGAPGVERDEIGKGLWPNAPNLAKTVSDWTPAELFWITKNGIKFSAMPAWGPTHSDDELWGMVAFLKKLPQLSPAEYKEMEQKITGGERRAEHEHGEQEKKP